MYIDGTFLDEYVIAPDEIQQLGAGVDALQMGDKEMQQTEFGWTHGQGFAMAAYPVRGRVQAQAMVIDHVLGKLGCAPAQYRLDSRFQLLHRKRFGDVVIRAGFQALQLVFFLAFGSEQNDRQRPGA